MGGRGCCALNPTVSEFRPNPFAVHLYYLPHKTSSDLFSTPGRYSPKFNDSNERRPALLSSTRLDRKLMNETTDNALATYISVPSPTFLHSQPIILHHSLNFTSTAASSSLSSLSFSSIALRRNVDVRTGASPKIGTVPQKRRLAIAHQTPKKNRKKQIRLGS